MINIELEKPVMEHEEGINHLLIQVHIPERKEIMIDIELPEGMYRETNLNGYYEDYNNLIYLYGERDVISLAIELYTENPIDVGEKIIKISCKPSDNQFVEYKIPIKITDSYLDDYEINEQVTNKIKELCSIKTNNNEFTSYKPITYSHRSTVSSLERKYRIDY
ncbi:hypothetical protein IHV09_09960 [Fictibacillus sp. 23RED33]|uniref:hypothetical protein n=1 Tax=Fictibacillus sp. 23RED33 TaxID=2745879 RepID=UPI0018CC9BC7|nr:hypothetical protein [Fictibacillus sp. 23RED33]MBH0173885.1 hypothetical protein [Fictibacillus sp. 23RED33]